MKTQTNLILLVSAAAFLLGSQAAQADRRTVSRSSGGRSAYGVSGDRGSAVATRNGVAWSGENSSGAVGRRGAAVATDDGFAAAGRRGAVAANDNGVAVAGRRGVAVAGENGVAAANRYGGVAAVDRDGDYYRSSGAVVATRPVVTSSTTVVVGRPLPHGYIRTVPVGYKRITYRGYNCYYVGGIYYRAVMYEGATVYVIVT